MSGIEFGKTKEGNTVTKYLLKNKNGMEVAVMDLGATIVSVLVPDREELLRRYPEAVVDRATMDEILLLYVKGDQAK
mgnify:CR=1 FL=1